MWRCAPAYIILPVTASLVVLMTVPAETHAGLEPQVLDAMKWLGPSQPAKAAQPAKVKGGIPKKYRPRVEKALEWLARQQQADGHFEMNGGKYPVPMTAMAGMALLAEGSNAKNGKYSKQIRKAVDWLLTRIGADELRNGLIGNPTNQEESYRYMYGHGFGMLFLACVYGEGANQKLEKKLKEVLTKAVVYSGQAQSSRGGWYYTSRKEGGDKDEGSVTITQVQALRACKNAAVAVPKEIIDKAQDYLKKCTNPNTGAVWYSWISKQDRVAITAAAVACGFNAGDYKDEYVKKWLRYCKKTIPEIGGVTPPTNHGHFEYTHYYFAQCMYLLGDNRWGELFPGEDGQVTWTKYREVLFDDLMKKQHDDGFWTGTGGSFSSVGPLYSTAIFATIMQLDRNVLPIYAR
jgi:hypothetical protein